MPRRAARTDHNQTAIVQALRAIGCSVQVLSAVGRGCPDVLCGRHGINFLLEIKNPNVPKSDRQLTPDERRWHDEWRGQVWVVASVDEALGVVLAGAQGEGAI